MPPKFVQGGFTLAIQASRAAPGWYDPVNPRNPENLPTGPGVGGNWTDWVFLARKILDADGQLTYRSGWLAGLAAWSVVASSYICAIVALILVFR